MCITPRVTTVTLKNTQTLIRPLDILADLLHVIFEGLHAHLVYRVVDSSRLVEGALCLRVVLASTTLRVLGLVPSVVPIVACRVAVDRLG